MQISSITGASLSDCLVSYLVHSLEESYLFAEMQSVYSAILLPADWTSWLWVGVPIRVPCMGQLDLSKYYLYFKGPCETNTQTNKQTNIFKK